MYTFIDVNETPGDVLLPVEALQINGDFIENIIPGYRTLYVKGREALSPEVEAEPIGASDGSEYKKKRYPARSIVVTYQLLAASNSEFRDAFNQLGAILNVEDAELIFNDETDKYFIGTPSSIGEVPPGTNNIVSSFELLCMDPFKYSVEEYEATPTIDNGLGFAIDYDGTREAYPELEVQFYRENEVEGGAVTPLTGNGDCGYVAFFNDREKIIQLGDPEEEDGVTELSHTLINAEFKDASAWGAAAQSLWSVNNGVVATANYTQTGSPGMSNVSGTEYYLTGSSFGSGSKYHGPSISRAITDGATNFNMTINHKMCIGTGKSDSKQKGGMQCNLTDASNKIIAGFSIYKGADGKKGKIAFKVNGKLKETASIDLSYYNKYFGNDRAANKKKKIKAVKASRASVITKSGNAVTFDVGGIKRVYRDDAIINASVTKTTLMLSRYKTAAGLARNGIYWIKFIKDNCPIYRDIPNKFSTNDIVVADCGSGEIYLNNARSPGLGAMGNDWEGFYLSPGLNQIGVNYSDWVQDEYAPTFKIRYRKVYL